MVNTVFQFPIVMNFILPFLLIFAILFAVLERTKALGEKATQLNAIVSFVIGIMFISFVHPKEIVSNMVLFLTVFLIVAFIAIVLIGFLFGADLKGGFGMGTGLKWTLGIIVVLATIIALIWATGIDVGVIDFLFLSKWSEAFWSNLVFILIVAFAIAWVVGSFKSGKGSGDKKG